MQPGEYARFQKGTKVTTMDKTSAVFKIDGLLYIKKKETIIKEQQEHEANAITSYNAGTTLHVLNPQADIAFMNDDALFNVKQPTSQRRILIGKDIVQNQRLLAINQSIPQGGQVILSGQLLYKLSMVQNS